ncbi:clathrin adaptor complexes medium subunit family protein [Striga asiatica]|uniref:Clathrin adaptor complexes medium subunit family protein n=1 Tax=Striga asiatica TaxID=4170 RepID=A0A5A7RBN0_STRAF|nr:clathrin adaptor complexes medium subunit family protein [Striga asiatica]
MNAAIDGGRQRAEDSAACGSQRAMAADGVPESANGGRIEMGCRRGSRGGRDGEREESAKPHGQSPDAGPPPSSPPSSSSTAALPILRRLSRQRSTVQRRRPSRPSFLPAAPTVALT